MDHVQISSAPELAHTRQIDSEFTVRLLGTAFPTSLFPPARLPSVFSPFCCAWGPSQHVDTGRTSAIDSRARACPLPAPLVLAPPPSTPHARVTPRTARRRAHTRRAHMHRRRAGLVLESLTLRCSPRRQASDRTEEGAMAGCSEQAACQTRRRTRVNKVKCPCICAFSIRE